MDVMKFIRFLTAHIPEKHQRTSRYYGLFAFRHRSTLLVRAQRLFTATAAQPAPPESWADRRLARGQDDPTTCPNCGSRMSLLGIFGSPLLLANAPGLAINQRLPTNPMPMPDALLSFV